MTSRYGAYRPLITCLVARLCGNAIGARVVIPDQEFDELAGVLKVRSVIVDGHPATELEIVDGRFEFPIVRQP